MSSHSKINNIRKQEQDNISDTNTEIIQNKHSSNFNKIIIAVVVLILTVIVTIYCVFKYKFFSKPRAMCNPKTYRPTLPLDENKELKKDFINWELELD